MAESHVVVVSVAAAATLFVVYFGSWFVLRRAGIARLGIAWMAPLLAGLSWFGIVQLARTNRWVRTDEALFHHLYVLLVVGLPLVGVVLAALIWNRAGQAGTGAVRGALVVFVLILPAGAGIWATHVEPGWLRIDRASLAVNDRGELATAVTGARRPLRIGVIADIQTDAFGSFERRAIEMLMAERPDVIVVAGDMTQVDSGTFERIRADGVEMLSILDAPGGVFMISGNTDFGGDAAVEALARDSGITPLTDEVATIELSGRTLRIGGLSWPNNRRAEARAFVEDFARTSTADRIDLLLAHSPDAILNATDASPIDLVVSGHTHGGQIAIPFLGPIWNVTDLPDDVAAGGLHDVRGAQVYVSTGVGVQRGESPKVRFGVRPSVGVIEIG